LNKRRASIDPSQLGFTFDPPAPARRAAELAGLDRVVAATVALVLKDDPRSREEIAGAMSALLDAPVTKLMLDAYASEAREQHSISAARLLALIAATDRHDLLDTLVRRIGAALLVGEEIATAEIGHIDSEIARLRERRKAVAGLVSPIRRAPRP
jgi:hypothetical protein